MKPPRDGGVEKDERGGTGRKGIAEGGWDSDEGESNGSCPWETCRTGNPLSG